VGFDRVDLGKAYLTPIKAVSKRAMPKFLLKKPGVNGFVTLGKIDQ
jgi:hypothetical protein